MIFIITTDKNRQPTREGVSVEKGTWTYVVQFVMLLKLNIDWRRVEEFYSAAYSAKRRNFKMHTFRCNLKSIVLEKSEATAAFLSTALFSHDFANILE